ncbi:unannotated protein [freshwater metagenome]|uniref:Unannotated protein n=1 Tax=freshwater metagenome TaxID=449393 RepID=A0A6J7PZQ0_9ZZZZ
MVVTVQVASVVAKVVALSTTPTWKTYLAMPIAVSVTFSEGFSTVAVPVDHRNRVEVVTSRVN